MTRPKNATGWSNSPPCPTCGVAKSATIDTRPYNEVFVRRRRICEADHRWTTLEVNQTQFEALELQASEANRMKAQLKSFMEVNDG